MAQVVLSGSPDSVTPVILCAVHTTEDVTQFCGECSVLLCDQCSTGDHKPHSGKTNIREFRQTKLGELNKLLQKLTEEKTDFQKKLNVNDERHTECVKIIDQCKKCQQTDLLGLSSLQKTEDNRHSALRAYVKAQKNTVKYAILSVKNALKTEHLQDMIEASTNATHVLQTLQLDLIPSQKSTSTLQHNSRDTDNEDSMSDVISNDATKRTVSDLEHHDVIQRLLNGLILIAGLLNTVVWSYIVLYK